MEFVWLGIGVIGGFIVADRKGINLALAIIGGMLLGPLIFLMLLGRGADNKVQKCPSCASWVPAEARVCPKCTRDIPAGPMPVERRYSSGAAPATKR